MISTHKTLSNDFNTYKTLSNDFNTQNFIQIKTLISNLVWTTCFWNNLHQLQVCIDLKNSWWQGRSSSSPVQSIVTCECNNHVVSV